MGIRPSSADASSISSRLGRPTDLARDLGISSQTIYLWRRQEQIDRGLVLGPWTICCSSGVTTRGDLLMQFTRSRVYAAFAAATAVWMMAVPTTYGAATAKAYKLTGEVRPATRDAFAGRPTARAATVKQQPVSLVDPDYYILSATQTSAANIVGLEAIAGVPLGLSSWRTIPPRTNS